MPHAVRVQKVSAGGFLWLSPPDYAYQLAVEAGGDAGYEDVVVGERGGDVRGQQATQKGSSDLRGGAYGGEEGNERVSLLLGVAHPAERERMGESIPGAIARDEGRVGTDVWRDFGKGVIYFGRENVIIIGRFGDVVQIDG